jgi:hypothetical protein
MLVSVTVALTHQCYIYIENRLLFIFSRLPGRLCRSLWILMTSLIGPLGATGGITLELM